MRIFAINIILYGIGNLNVKIVITEFFLYETLLLLLKYVNKMYQ